MNNKFRGFLLGFLVLCAVFSSVFAFYTAGDAKNEALSSEAIGSDNNYVLREYEGYVAVFVENDPSRPMTVTDIQVATLREFDQMLLQTGMKVQTHERLVMMLEDLGS